mmetsp:Transcript_24840/g.80284  ORF Transcript_24840/g.80284 Transcript_24840/m.80284 type:complete len:225 (-) Transcript_24840:47-721(-)
MLPAKRPRAPSVLKMAENSPSTPRALVPVCAASLTRSRGAVSVREATPAVPPATIVCQYLRPGTGFVADPRSLPSSGSESNSDQRSAMDSSEASGTNSKASSNSRMSTVPSPPLSTDRSMRSASSSVADVAPSRRSARAISNLSMTPEPSRSTASKASRTRPRSKSVLNSINVKVDRSPSTSSQRAMSEATKAAWFDEGSAFSSSSAARSSAAFIVPERSRSCL